MDFLKLFIIILSCINGYDCQSRIVINEINSDDPSKPEKNEFIELVAFGKKRPSDSETSQLEELSLRGYKILIISAYQKGAKGPTIELVANLWNHKIKNSFFVFGGIGIENADMKVDSSWVTYREKFTKKTPSLFGFFSNANVYPHAVALVYRHDGLPDIKLSEKRPYIKITPDIKQLISDTLVDMVVYGRRAVAEQCEIFEELHDDFRNQKYLLREFDVPTDSEKDYSLNRCTSETSSFLPERFKLGKRTPKTDNDCTGARFVLEKNILKVTGALTRHHREDLSAGGQRNPSEDAPQCSSSLQPEDYWGVLSPKVTRYVQTIIDSNKMNEICSLANEGDFSNDGSSESPVASADTASKLMGVTPKEREWDTTTLFQDRWIALISQHQSKILPLKTITENKVWFEYIPNTQVPAESTYRCRLCSKYFDKFQLERRYKPALADSNGLLKNSYDSNREMIVNHGKQSQHLAIVSKLERAALENLPKQFKKMQAENENADNKNYAVTMKMMRTVYAEVKVNLPFSSHPKIVRLQEANGLNLGFHHYDRTAASRMVNLISSEMHKTMLKHLTEKQLSLSLIIDSSTDASQHHYLIVYLQALESNAPVIYFYKLVLLDADESAAGILRVLINEWSKEDNNFERYIKRNLRGFASDGAPVMMGKTNGLKKLLDDWTDRKLYAIHCMAHRLHLATRKALKNIPYFSAFEDNINEIHNFYTHHGHKRRAHLRELAEVLNIRLYELSYIFEARWISSEFKALKNVNNTWSLVVTDLESISQDQSFSGSTRNQAKGIAQKLKNKNFLLILQFTCDVLQVLSHWSKRLQQRSGILVGSEEYRQQMILTFEELKSKDAGFLTYFLSTIVCSESPLSGKCSIEKYEAVPSIRWQHIELLPGARVPTFNTIREPFLTNIINELNSYFPEGSLRNFDVFMPERIPQKEAEIILYGHEEIQALSMLFNFDSSASSSEWTEILLKIIKESDFCRFQSVETVLFWQHFLNSGLLWGDNIKSLLQTVLILPISSADAERGFSIMNHIRTSRRSRLEGVSLDSLMRLRVNGPNELEQFKAGKYAKAWVEKHMRTDDPAQQRKKAKKDVIIDETENLDLIYLPTTSLF